MINQVNYNTSGNKTLTETFIQVLPRAVGTRYGVMVQNLGEENIYIAFTQEQIDRNGGFRIDPGVTYYFDTVSPNNEVFARSESSAGSNIEYMSNEN